MPKHGNCGKRPYYYAPPTASANWRYITDEDRTGPRKNEIMLSTMDAKKAFALHLLRRELRVDLGPHP